MTEEESGPGRQRRPPKLPFDNGATAVKQSVVVSVLDEIDWEQVRSTAVKITGQIKAAKEVEHTVRKQLQGPYDTEWQGKGNCQELALGIAQSVAAEWLLAHLDWHELQAYMYALTHRVGSIDEITQAVRDKLLRITPATWEQVTDRKKYLDSIVHHAAMDWMRREEAQQYAAARRLRHTLSDEYDSADVATRACAQRDVATLLGRLGPRVRQAFVLRQAWGYSVKEVASRMSIGEETVKTYLTKAAEVFSELEECRENPGAASNLTRWSSHKEEE